MLCTSQPFLDTHEGHLAPIRGLSVLDLHCSTVFPVLLFPPGSSVSWQVPRFLPLA
jgi:hypothetical protein